LHPLILIVAAFVLPPLWGWLVYRVMKWCWPRRAVAAARTGPAVEETRQVDFQI
jgi:hypothetical protein